MIIVDSIFGFTTHKMNVRFRSNRRLSPQWKLAVEKFQQHLDYEQCFTEVTSIGNWYDHLLARKSPIQLITFKEHVNIQNKIFRINHLDVSFSSFIQSKFRCNTSTMSSIFNRKIWRKSSRYKRMVQEI